MLFLDQDAYLPDVDLLSGRTGEGLELRCYELRQWESRAQALIIAGVMGFNGLPIHLKSVSSMLICLVPLGIAWWLKWKQPRLRFTARWDPHFRPSGSKKRRWLTIAGSAVVTALLVGGYYTQMVWLQVASIPVCIGWLSYDLWTNPSLRCQRMTGDRFLVRGVHSEAIRYLASCTSSQPSRA